MQKKMKAWNNWLLIANGAPLCELKLRALAEHRRVMVLDGAYCCIKELGLNIDVLLGDFDSLDPCFLQQAKKATIEIIHTPDQNQTDFEKGIRYLDSRGAEDILVCAATGRRLQHTLYNLRLLKKFYHPRRSMVLLTATESIRYLQNETFRLVGKIGDGVGLFGFPHAKATTCGLHYEMRDFALTFADQASVSNALLQQEAIIQIAGEALCIHEDT